MKNKDQIANIFLKDIDGEKLEISSPLETNDDGRSSFQTTNPKTKERYKVSFKIEEL